MQDAELISRFVAGGERAGEAFRTLVDRHIPMVYSVCLRQLRDPHWAEDVSQAVFILLAKKAGRLKAGVVVGGWLYRTAVFACSNARDLKRTRTFHETRVDVAMTRTDDDPQEPVEQQEVEGLLDAGLTELPAGMREVLVERYFENKTVAEIAKGRGQSVYATEKALETGLKKVRRFLAKRGVSVSGVLLAAILTRQAAASVPAGLAAAATSAAVSGGAAASTGVGVLVARVLKAASQAKLLAAVSGAVACLLMATVVLAFTGAPQGPGWNAGSGGAGVGSVIATSAGARAATAAEQEDLLGTLRRAAAALRKMDTAAFSREVAFTDARAAAQWETMARLFESDYALKAAAAARLGEGGNALTMIPTFDQRLNEIMPVIDTGSGDFRILRDRAVCRFVYRDAAVAGGAIYFVRVDERDGAGARWRIDAGTTLAIDLQGSTDSTPRRALELLSPGEQTAVVERMQRLNLGLRTVAAQVASGAIASVEQARAELRRYDTDGAGEGRAFFSLALRRDQNEQARY